MATSLAAACRALPIFPLPRVVLLPGSHLPLHVFETRYRALVRFCVAEGLPMGVATLQGVDSPEIYPEIGLGTLVQVQTLPDGRSNIVLRYAGRARYVADRPTDEPFRVVDAAFLPEPDDVPAADLVARIRVLLGQLAGYAGSDPEASRILGLDPVEMVDLVARKVVEDPDERRAFLGARSFTARAESVLRHLAGYLGRVSPQVDE